MYPNVHRPKRKIFLLAGEDETLRDDALWFAKHALGINWRPESYSKSRRDYSADELEYKSENVQAYIERYSVHDEMTVFEKALAGIKEGKSVDELGDDCFGTKSWWSF